MVDLKSILAEKISEKTGIDKSLLYGLIEVPPDKALGDYSLPCFRLSPVLKKNPAQISMDLKNRFTLPDDIVRKIEVKGPYFNMFLDGNEVTKLVIRDIVEKDFSDIGEEGKDKIVVIDYSSPNIAKPFGIGHLRSTVIGNSLKNIFKFLGYNVIGINHLGDWGTQFGKLITAFKKWGSEEGLKDEPVKYLYNLYVKFHREAENNPGLEDEAREWFSKLERGDKEARELWKKFCDLSLKEFKRIYDRLGVDFEYYLGESFYSSMIDETIEKIKESGITEISEGALIVPLEDMPPALLKKSDGSTLYLTRDIAAAIYRHSRFNFDLMLYVVGSPQSLHFKQMFSVLKKMGMDWVKNCHHVAFGHIRFENESMSTRKGNIILLEDVLDRVVELAKSIIQEKNPDIKDKERVAEAVGIGAVIFNDLKSSRIKDVIFDWNEILNFNGETGVYLQYTHARISSLLRKFNERYGSIEYNSSINFGEELFSIAFKLKDFEPVVLKSSEEFEPSLIARYLLDLAGEYNSFYNRYRIITDDYGVSLSRILVSLCVKNVLKSGLELLGVAAIEEM